MKEDIFIPVYRTNVLPLRWLANYIFHPISMVFFRIALKANQKLEYDYTEATLFDELKEKVGFRVYNFFDKPYTWWGTTYMLDKNLLSDTTGLGWDDYDENGIPYWDYFWHTDEETGDGWRLVNKTYTNKMYENQVDFE
mgnify:CR=1 FL=1